MCTKVRSLFKFPVDFNPCSDKPPECSACRPDKIPCVKCRYLKSLCEQFEKLETLCRTETKPLDPPGWLVDNPNEYDYSKTECKECPLGECSCLSNEIAPFFLDELPRRLVRTRRLVRRKNFINTEKSAAKEP